MRRAQSAFLPRTIAIAILGRWPPGFFLLFAIGELVSNKPCVILAASWWLSSDGQCRDEMCYEYRFLRSGCDLRTDIYMSGGSTTSLYFIEIWARGGSREEGTARSSARRGPFDEPRMRPGAWAWRQNPMGRAPFSRNLFCRLRDGSGM